MFAEYNSEFGIIRIEYQDNRITGICRADLKSDSGRACSVSDTAFLQLREYFSGRRRRFELPLCLTGTEFQKRVWKALLEIPYGQVRTYGEIARAIGRPNAARAVGAACSRNPLWIAVPCHRVIGADGSLTGYAGGTDMKEKLLELEKSHCDF